MKNAMTKLNNTELNGRRIHIIEDSSSSRRRRSHHAPLIHFHILSSELSIFFVESTVSDCLVQASDCLWLMLSTLL